MHRFAAAALVLLAACGPASPGPGPGPGPQAPAKLPRTEPACRRPVDTSKVIALDGAALMQIEPNVAFDGSLWVVYSKARADGESGFDVAATRIECDGTVALEPFTVSTGPHSNDVDPVVSVGVGRVLVAWSSDDSERMPNLSLRYRFLDPNGTPLAPQESLLATTREGKVAEDANQWMPSAAALDGGRFALAGARGFIDTPGGFRTFVQTLGADGRPEGETVDMPVGISGGHDSPGIAAQDDGTLLLAWARSEDDGVTSRIEQSRIPAGGAASPPAPAFVGRKGDYSDVAGAVWAPHAYVGFQSELEGLSSIVVRDFAPEENRPALEFSTPGANSYGAAVAVSKSGGAVAWFAQDRYARRTVRARSFAYDGHAFVASEPVQIAASAAPYQPSIVHVGARVWFVAWTEGSSPDFVVKGRFVEL